MRCYICDNEINKPTFDDNHKALPCSDCQEEVYESLMEFDEEEHILDARLDDVEMG